MRMALITTTINVPHVLSLYRAYDPDVQFFIAGDEKSPHDAIMEMELPNTFYYGPTAQRALGYKCSEFIGWNCIQRRNIALLEALKWGADVIVSIDDDNLPLDPGFFVDLDSLFSLNITGVQAIPDRWFNVGLMTHPRWRQRGVPVGACPYKIAPIIESSIGVVQGVCLGNPDISAEDRSTGLWEACSPHEILRNGVFFKPQPNKWTVFNTQSTAMVRELAPAWFCPPALGRFDDIVASLITQRIMRETFHTVHFGAPFVYQERNEHDIKKDLEQERWGTEQVEHVAQQLDALVYLDECTSVLSMCKHIWHAFADCPWFPQRAVEAAFAFLEDVEFLL